MNAQRNCLSKIPARYIVDAMGQLPPCGPASTTQQLGVDLPIWGGFRVTFKPLKQAHQGEAATWTWAATQATPTQTSWLSTRSWNTSTQGEAGLQG
jgi:hypothetical protein